MENGGDACRIALGFGNIMDRGPLPKGSRSVRIVPRRM